MAAENTVSIRTDVLVLFFVCLVGSCAEQFRTNRNNSEQFGTIQNRVLQK